MNARTRKAAAAAVRLLRSKTPYAVICRLHGQQFLTREQYHQQLDRPDAAWRCPMCGDDASFDDKTFEDSQMLLEEP